MKQTYFYLVFWKKRSIHKEVTEKDKDSLLCQLTKDALLNLNFNSFKLFENEIQQSTNYHCCEISDDLGSFFSNQRKNSNATRKMFRDHSQKWNCDFRLSEMMICRNKICIGNNFNIDNFDIQRYYRKESTISKAIGEDLDYKNKWSIVNDMFTSIGECAQECTLDKHNAFFVDTTDAYSNEEEDPKFNDHYCSQRNFQINNDDIIINDDTDNIFNEKNSTCDYHDDKKNVTSGIKLDDFISTNDNRHINSEIFNNFKRANR